MHPIDEKTVPKERELLAKVARGDQRAFNELFEAYYSTLGEYVLKTTKSISLTEEIVQDAFIKIWMKRETLTQISNFKNYLIVTCRKLMK